MPAANLIPIFRFTAGRQRGLRPSGGERDGEGWESLAGSPGWSGRVGAGREEGCCGSAELTGETSFGRSRVLGKARLWRRGQGRKERGDAESAAALYNSGCEISGLQRALEGVRTKRGRTRVGAGALAPASRVSARALLGLGRSWCQNSSVVSNPPKAGGSRPLLLFLSLSGVLLSPPPRQDEASKESGAEGCCGGRRGLGPL